MSAGMILDSPEAEILDFLLSEDLVIHKHGNPLHTVGVEYLAASIAYIVNRVAAGSGPTGPQGEGK